MFQALLFMPYKVLNIHVYLNSNEHNLTVKDSCMPGSDLSDYSILFLVESLQHIATSQTSRGGTWFWKKTQTCTGPERHVLCELTTTMMYN